MPDAVPERLAYTPAQVAEVLGLGRTTVYQLLATGELSALRVGKAIRVPVEALQAWMREKATRHDD